jgi:SAM-dependent methyltransferase
MTDPFKTYIGQEKSFWTKHHSRYGTSILAVGRGNATPATNEAEYRKARELFVQLVTDDFPGDRGDLSVLDCGFGHGHYAKACHELGFGRYVGLDFASKVHPKIGPSYVFENRDLGAPFDLKSKFDLVICIDVIFHLVDDAKFKVAIANIAKHAKNKIYITSLFRTVEIAPYVKHRPLAEYAGLRARHGTMMRWRDNNIVRFQVEG